MSRATQAKNSRSTSGLMPGRSALRLAAGLCLALVSLFSQRLIADTVLETETAELGHQGEFTFSSAVQWDQDKAGRTIFTLTQFEFALTDRAELLIEPFFQEWDSPKDGPGVHGMGDLEITPSYMVFLERPILPAIVVALKVKVPTATNDLGTGEYDYYPYLIFGKHVGPWVLNANFGMDFITSPAGEPLKNQWIYDFSVERDFGEKWSIYGEAFGNSSPAHGEYGTLAGAVAAEYQFISRRYVFVSVGYDTDDLLSVRSGVTFNFF